MHSSAYHGAREGLQTYTFKTFANFFETLQQQRLRPREQHSDASISKVAYGSDFYVTPVCL